MTIVPLTPENFDQTALVYRLSWQESHRHICSKDFLHRRDCAGYLRQGIQQGKKIFLLTDPEPVGLVSILGEEIGDLYVHPEKMGLGYGTALLSHALNLTKRPRLSVLSDNLRAIKLYERFGFRPTSQKPLRDGLWEVTMEITP